MLRVTSGTGLSLSVLARTPATHSYGGHESSIGTATVGARMLAECHSCMQRPGRSGTPLASRSRSMRWRGAPQSRRRTRRADWWSVPCPHAMSHALGVLMTIPVATYVSSTRTDRFEVHGTILDPEDAFNLV